jgi:hypothetical protein
VSDWGPSNYGQPCRECAFDWSLTLDDAVALTSDVAAAYGEVLAGATGAERHPDLAWSLAAYVSHVADNLRIWAERLMGVALGASPMVGGYDENELARARNYDLIPLEAALWSLARSVAEWTKAVAASRRQGTLMTHPERRDLDLLAVVRSNAHDVCHHLLDVQRTIRAGAAET